jgi:Lon protease-like protein
MPKCKSYVVLSELDIPSVINACNTSTYIAIIREEYRNTQLKRGCIARVSDFIVDDETQQIKLEVFGIKRFMSYQNIQIANNPYEVIKPDFRLFDNDDTTNPPSVDLNTLDTIFIQCFWLFLNELNLQTSIDFNSLSLDKFINSLITIMPISDMEKFHLSEIPSLVKRQENLSVILNCQFNGLTDTTKYN